MKQSNQRLQIPLIQVDGEAVQQRVADVLNALARAKITKITFVDFRDPIASWSNTVRTTELFGISIHSGPCEITNPEKAGLTISSLRA